jgi:hypothetical protein
MIEPINRPSSSNSSAGMFLTSSLLRMCMSFSFLLTELAELAAVSEDDLFEPAVPPFRDLS